MTEYLFESRLLVAILQASMKAATEQGAIECCLGMENVLKYCLAYKGALAWESRTGSQLVKSKLSQP